MSEPWMMTATEVAASGAAPSASAPESSDLVMLCHDLRAAVRGVLGGVGLVDPAGLDASSCEQLARAAASARTIEALVGLVESEAEHPVVAERDETVETEAFLDALRHRHAGAAREHGVGFVVALATNAPAALRLDVVALARILDNLIDDALRSAGNTGDVRVTAETAAGGGVLFRVSALGAGPAWRPQGTSFGDNIARCLAARIGGILRPLGAENAATGTELAVPADCVVSSPAERPARAGLNGLRVLLAEDNPTNQMVATQMLRALGVRVIVCADGAEALACFAQHEVDLVLVDIEMPRISGLEVIRAIRARTDARGRVPIVALTAYAMREHRERIAAAGADGLIPKPLTSVEALARSLAACVAQAPSAEAVPAVTPGAPSGEPVIDAAIFEALCETIGRDTVAELLDKVVTDMMAARRDLAGAVAPLDRDRVRSASHILISVAGALGAVRLQTRARSLNGMVPAGLGPEIVENVHLCLSEIDAAVAFARSAAS